jgi:DNA-binding response OmpR family regulator
MLSTATLAGRSTRAVILALSDSAMVAATVQRLHRANWRVYRASSCDALRRLTCHMTPDVVVLPADGSDESGWLTCAKLLREIPDLRVIVVGDPTANETEFARFIGATLVPGDVNADELADYVEGAVAV